MQETVQHKYQLFVCWAKQQGCSPAAQSSLIARQGSMLAAPASTSMVVLLVQYSHWLSETT
jgi:hypothetical protein